MKKTIKVMITVLVILAILLISANSYAFNPKEINGSGISVSTETVKAFANRIVAVVRVVGSLVAVVILLILGIKYMMGSAEEKADYKKSMIPYLVGAVIVFAASQIAGIVYDLATTIGQTTETTTGG